MTLLEANPPRNLLQLRLPITMRDCQLDFKVSVPAILNWLQEAASQHAETLGVGIQALQAQGVTWMLGRMSLRITRTPKWGETLTLATWPSGIHRRLIAERQFILADAAGNTLVEASSEWLCVNLSTGKLAPLPEAVKTLAAPDTLNFGLCKRPIAPHPVEHEAPYREGFIARKAEIDANHHVNNVHFATWLREPLPEALYFDETPHAFDIEYKLPVKAGDCVTAMVWPLPERTFIHHLTTSEGTLIARAQSIYPSKES
jgi:acyl-ACP thioesterase